jgi:hypothetical protein
MAASLARYVGPLGQRGFWSFRTIHALTGALLTVLGAGSGVFINENIKHQISDLDSRIEDANQRYQDINQALFQFRFAQTNAITFGVLSANDSLKPEFRQSMVDLMFVTRQMPTEIMLADIHAADQKGFAAARQAYLDLVDKAKKATSQADWDAVNAYEFDQESQLFDIQQKLIAGIDQLKEEKRRLEGQLDFAIVGGFSLQQIGFVVVLLAGLLHQHRTPEPLPLYEMHGHQGPEERP